MGETANTIPPKGLGKIQISDFWKSLFLAAIVNVLLALYPIISGGNWPTLSDLQAMLKSTVAIIIAYIIKNLSTNNVGEILTKDKPVMTVSTAVVNDLVEKAADDGKGADRPKDPPKVP